MILKVFPQFAVASWSLVGKTKGFKRLLRFFFLSFLKTGKRIRFLKKNFKVIRGVKGPKKSFFVLKSFVVSFSNFWNTYLGFSKIFFNIFFYLVISSFFSLEGHCVYYSKVYKF